jgi:hypothetical protein
MRMRMSLWLLGSSLGEQGEEPQRPPHLALAEVMAHQIAKVVASHECVSAIE